MQNVRIDRAVLEGSARYTIFGSHDAAGGHASDVGYGFGYGKYSSNEVQRLQLTYVTAPTSGDIDLVFDGQQTTLAVPYNATATDVLTSLEGLSNIAIGDVSVSGGPWPGAPIDVTFIGTYASTDVSLMTTASNTLNNSATLTPVERVKGGSTELYVAAIKKNGSSTVTMYTVNVTTGVMTSVATGLTASDWFFEQYGDRIWAVNATDGLQFLRLGGSWNDGAGTTRPKAPVVPPTFAYALQFASLDFSSGWTFTQTGLAGAPTLTGLSDSIKVVADTALTAQTVVTLTATNAATVDYQFNDSWEAAAFANQGTGEARFVREKMHLTLVNDDTTTLTPIVEVYDGNITGDGAEIVYSHYANSQRTLRDNVKKIVFKVTMDAWPTGKQVNFSTIKGESWMNDYVPFEFTSNPKPKPKINKIRYAYSYYNATTTVESQLSEEGITQNIPANYKGVKVTLTLRGSSELTTSDRIYVYRKELASGIWRRLPTDSNNLNTWGSANVTSGTTTFVDRWMEEELKDFRAHESASFANSRSTLAGLVIGRWKQSLAIGASRKVWLSFSGFLTSESPRFAPDPDDKAATTFFVQNESDNPDIGRTSYMSDNRSEDVLMILGQDSLYLAGPNSSYAMVGDSPGDASRPRRLPNSRGVVGKRAGCLFGGGVELGAEDGLWYSSVGRGFSGEDNGALVTREETIEVRRSWITTLLGSSYSGLVVREHEDNLTAYNGAKYLMRDRDGRWMEGTFTDSVLEVLSVRSRGLKFMDSKGRVFSVSDSYTTDNGTAVTWSYETGILDGPATKITDIELQVKGSPRVKVWVFAGDGDKNYTGFGKYREYVFDTVESQEAFRRPLSILPGMRYKILFSGTVGSDEVHTCALEIAASGKQLNG